MTGRARSFRISAKPSELLRTRCTTSSPSGSRTNSGRRWIDPVLHLCAEVTSDRDLEALRKLCDAIVDKPYRRGLEANLSVRVGEYIDLAPDVGVATHSEYLAAEDEPEVGARHPHPGNWTYAA